MKKLIHITRPGSIQLVLLLACLVMPINSNAQMFGGSMIPRRSTSTITIPDNLVLGKNESYVISSVYDENYLPYSITTSEATIGPLDADANKDLPVVDIQGTITTTGVSIYIPVSQKVASTYDNLPRFSTMASVPANLTEDGISRSLVLSWEEQIITLNSRYVVAKLVAIGGPLNVKKLDMNRGIGGDFLGILLTTLRYPYNGDGDMTNFSVRGISAVPDKKFGQTDNTGSINHNFLYVPIKAEDGKIWLNNNLGATYASYNDKDKTSNLNNQAKAYTDYQAYGSLFQWGRKPDGHELVTWTSSTAGIVTETDVIQVDVPLHAKFILNLGATTNSDWRVNPNSSLWANGSAVNTPCPNYFKVPTVAEHQAFRLAAKINNIQSAANSKLRLTAPGSRKKIDGLLNGTGVTGNYWTSSTTFDRSNYYSYSLIDPYGSTTDRSNGYVVRCIVDPTYK